MVFQILVIASLLIFVVGGALWWFFLIRGLRRVSAGSQATFVGTILAQIAFAVFCLGLVRGQFLSAPIMATFPPVALLVFVPDLSRFSDLIADTLRILAPILLLFGLGIIAKRALRPFAFLLLFLLGLVGGILVANEIGHRAMCREAARLGFSEVQRHSLLWSLAYTPREFQFEIHAIARQGEMVFGWSYSEMTWYPLSDAIWPNVTGGRPACGSV